MDHTDKTPWLTMSELSRATQVPDSTCRRYVLQLKEFFVFDQRARGRRFHPKSVEIINLIHLLFAEGRQLDQVREILAQNHAITVNLDEDEVAVTKEPLPSLVTKEDFDALFHALVVSRQQQAEEMNQLKEIVLEVQQQNQQLREHIDEKLEARDRVLTQTLKELMGAKQEKSGSIFSNIFKKRS